MTQRKRTPYQREMDAIHVPEEKANETLRNMLAENHRLAERKGSGRRILWAAVAAAAACLALVIGLNAGQKEPPQPQWKPTSLSISRSFADTFGTEPEALFPGWEITEEYTETVDLPEGTGHEGRLTLKKEDAVLQAAVTDYEPEVWATAQEEQTLAGQTVRIGKDSETGSPLAVFRRDGLYTVLTGSFALFFSDK